MNRDSVIQFVDGAFTTELGAPWRWADLAMTKVYQTLMAEGDEYLAAGKLITEFNRLKERGGFKYQHRPKLYWRWADKVRYVDGEMIARVYLDGSPPYQHTNPQRPNGRPTVGQVRLCAP
jgi:hypothetical protein